MSVYRPPHTDDCPVCYPVRRRDKIATVVFLLIVVAAMLMGWWFRSCPSS